MRTNLAPSDSPSKCTACGAEIWLARFPGGRRAVERAAKQRGPFGHERPVGHVALTFPLLPGGEILGAIVRGLTRFRIHDHAARAYVAATIGRKVR